jgi:hypothetical protein
VSGRSKRRRQEATNGMLLSLLSELLLGLLAPVPEDFLHVQARRPVEKTLALIVQIHLLRYNVLHFRNTLLDALSQGALVELESECLASDGTSGHGEAQVLRPVDQFEDGSRRVVARAVSVLVNARVSSRPEGVTFGESREYFWDDIRFEKEALGTTVGREVAAFAESNNLRER